MNKKLIALIIASAFSMSAMATPDAVCGNGQHTGNPHCDITPPSGNNTETGGTGIGVGIANVENTVKVHSSNSNHNSNSNSNANNNANSNSNVQGQAQKQSTENSNNSTVTVQGDNFNQARIPVSTAYSASIAPTAQCALGISGGVQIMGFGGTIAKAYVDENCQRLEQIRTVALVLKDTNTAEALMCQDKAYAKARSTAGRACPVEAE